MQVYFSYLTKLLITHLDHECDIMSLTLTWYVWHSKDFDVGQIYKKKIVLTNVSYSVNYCRLVGISEWLKDFISVQ